LLPCKIGKTGIAVIVADTLLVVEEATIEDMLVEGAAVGVTCRIN
jgi:hypothetical protein